jgi:hypothetical protein
MQDGLRGALGYPENSSPDRRKLQDNSELLYGFQTLITQEII